MWPERVDGFSVNSNSACTVASGCGVSRQAQATLHMTRGRWTSAHLAGAPICIRREHMPSALFLFTTSCTQANSTGCVGWGLPTPRPALLPPHVNIKAHAQPLHCAASPPWACEPNTRASAACSKGGLWSMNHLKSRCCHTSQSMQCIRCIVQLMRGPLLPAAKVGHG